MWKLSPQFLTTEPIRVAVVGVGGTGSEVVSNLVNLHNGLMALGYGGLDVVAFDPDTVSEANIVRQRYAPSDIGLKKAEVLIHRVNLAYSFGWKAVAELFSHEAAKLPWDLVISCVDTARARDQLHRYAFADRYSKWKYWLDCGNDQTTGQVVLGTPRHAKYQAKSFLPCATELHPELRDKARPDDAPSCSAIEALSRQDLLVNKAVALYAVDLLWQLFRHGQLEVHARYFDLRGSTLAGRMVPREPERAAKKPPKNSKRKAA